MNIVNVRDINKYIKALFDQDIKLASLFVRGEISNFKQHSSGHCYFTLKDSESTIRVVMFKSKAQFLKFEPQNGLKVIAGGRITVYERDGQYQLYVDQLLPQGVGELSLAYAQLKDKLGKEGLFDPSRKRLLPVLPRSIGVITSPTGAAVRDIVTVSKRRHPGIQIILCPVKVQGFEAPDQIVQALRMLNDLGNVDVVILGRGGGSIEELWAFNDENVVRAVAASTIPTVSAVGHQTDYTLTDFAADVRAATPSQAAELVVPDVKEVIRYIKSMESMLQLKISSLLRKQRLRLEQCLDSRLFRYPKEFLYNKQQLIDKQFERLEQAVRKNVTTNHHKFNVFAEKLAVLNPLAVMARGYSIVQDEEKNVIRTADQVFLGMRLHIFLQEGSIDAKVIDAGGKEDETQQA